MGEREQLLSALEQSRWNQSRAASRLGMSRTTLWRKMREHHLNA
jgi:transcriptional regulator of acetoin/glycerol metabolism